MFSISLSINLSKERHGKQSEGCTFDVRSLLYAVVDFFIASALRVGSLYLDLGDRDKEAPECLCKRIIWFVGGSNMFVHIARKLCWDDIYRKLWLCHILASLGFHPPSFGTTCSHALTFQGVVTVWPQTDKGPYWNPKCVGSLKGDVSTCLAFVASRSQTGPVLRSWWPVAKESKLNVLHQNRQQALTTNIARLLALGSVPLLLTGLL